MNISLNTTREDSTPQKSRKLDQDLSTYGRQSDISSSTIKSKYPFSDVLTSDFSLAKKLQFCRRKISIKIQKQQKLKRKRILKAVLGKMLLNKFMNNKIAFNKIKKIPDCNAKVKNHKKNLRQEIVKQLIFKTPITMETAFLRSIINLRKMKQKFQYNQLKQQQRKQNGKNMSIITLNHSVTVYPHEEYTLKYKEKDGIIFLNQIAKQRLKLVILCFQRNAKKSHQLKCYLQKVIQNFKLNQRYFIQKLRKIASEYRQNCSNTKKKLLQNLLSKCIKRRDKLIIQNLKQSSWALTTKKLISLQLLEKYVKFEKLSAFFAIYKYSNSILIINKQGNTNLKLKDKQVQVQQIEAEQIKLINPERSLQDHAKQFLLRQIAKQNLRQWTRRTRVYKFAQLLQVKLTKKLLQLSLNKMKDVKKKLRR